MDLGKIGDWPVSFPWLLKVPILNTVAGHRVYVRICESSVIFISIFAISDKFEKHSRFGVSKVEGTIDGSSDGTSDGVSDGTSDGMSEGICDGESEGKSDGGSLKTEIASDGFEVVGAALGTLLGWSLGN